MRIYLATRLFQLGSFTVVEEIKAARLSRV